MILIFKDYKGKRKVVGNPHSQSQAFSIMNKYCLNNNKKIKYYRMCAKDWGNDIMITTFDFGSHSEFFYLADEKYKKELMKSEIDKRRIRTGKERL